jgi:hypothetical protein
MRGGLGEEEERRRRKETEKRTVLPQKNVKLSVAPPTNAKKYHSLSPVS